MNELNPTSTYLETTERKLGYVSRDVIRENLRLKLFDFMPLLIGSRNFGMRTMDDKKYYNSGQELEHAVKGGILLSWGAISAAGLVSVIYLGVDYFF